MLDDVGPTMLHPFEQALILTTLNAHSVIAVRLFGTAFLNLSDYHHLLRLLRLILNIYIQIDFLTRTRQPGRTVL